MDKPSPSFVHAFVQDIFLPVAPDFTMAAFFVITWIKPYAMGKNAPNVCFAILILEVLTILSNLLVYANIGKKAKLIALIIFFAPIVIALGRQTRAFIPILAFAWHTYTKINIVAGATREDGHKVFARWLLSILLWSGTAFLVAILPFPELGWREGIVPAEIAWTNGETGEKLYHATPAWGAFYFFILAWLEIYVQTHKKKFDEFLKRFARIKEN